MPGGPVETVYLPGLQTLIDLIRQLIEFIIGGLPARTRTDTTSSMWASPAGRGSSGWIIP